MVVTVNILKDFLDDLINLGVGEDEVINIASGYVTIKSLGRATKKETMMTSFKIENCIEELRLTEEE